MRPLKTVTVGDIRADLEELCNLHHSQNSSDQHATFTRYLTMKRYLECEDSHTVSLNMLLNINELAYYFNLQLDI